MKKKLLVLLIAIFYFALFAFSLNGVLAAPISLSISPPLLEAVIKPGRAITQSYEVVNNGATDLYLQTRVVPFVPAGEQGRIRLDNSSWGIKNAWFSLQNTDLKLGDESLMERLAAIDI